MTEWKVIPFVRFLLKFLSLIRLDEAYPVFKILLEVVSTSTKLRRFLPYHYGHLQFYSHPALDMTEWKVIPFVRFLLKFLSLIRLDEAYPVFKILLEVVSTSTKLRRFLPILKSRLSEVEGVIFNINHLLSIRTSSAYHKWLSSNIFLNRIRQDQKEG